MSGRPLPPHGTTARYRGRDRCRCDQCRAANAAAGRAYQAARQPDRPAPQPRREPAHGTVSRYTNPRLRCRCPGCRAAVADYMRARRGADTGHSLAVRGRAVRRLIAAHLDEYERLLSEETAAARGDGCR